MLSFILWANQPSPSQQRLMQPADCATAEDAIAAGDYIKVVVGESHSCALTATGAVKCWGADEYGQLGDGSKLDHSTRRPQ